jgi:uncharacterized surface protein with fasciclin (FAS1) repeats
MNETSQFESDLERSNDACAEITTNTTASNISATVVTTSVTVLSSSNSTATTAVHGNLDVPQDTNEAVGLSPLHILRPSEDSDDLVKEATDEDQSSVDDEWEANSGQFSDDSQSDEASYNNVSLPTELNFENNSEPLDDNFYKRIQGDTDNESRGSRTPFLPRKVDPPLPLHAQPTDTLPGDSLLDALVPAVVMDHVSDDGRPLPVQVAQGETYHPSGQRITDTNTNMSNTVSIDAHAPAALPEPAKSATVPWYRRRRYWLVGAVLLVVVGVVLGSVCGSGKCHTNIRTVVDVVAEQPDLTNATKALYSTGLVHELCVFDCNYTIFAPMDTAFATSNPNIAIWNPPWILHLKGIVKNHIIEQRIESRDLTVGRAMTMLSKETVSVVHTDNGAIALMSVGTNLSNVTQTVYEAVNGVVHVLDTLLWPSFMGMDVLGLINTNGDRDYSILLDLVNRADMNESLTVSTYSGITFFAPNNAAFEGLGDKMMASLLNDTGFLQEVLSNHLAISAIPSVDIPSGGKSYYKQNGQVYLSRTANGTLLVNDAKVLTADALANNGIVHVIDKVLLEPYSPFTTESSATTFSWPICLLMAAMIVTISNFDA